jgi:hypothetical protein
VALASYHFNSSDMPAPTAQDPPLCGPFLLELVPLGTHPINLGEHSLQQGFGRGRGDARALKLADIAALSVDLDAPTATISTFAKLMRSGGPACKVHSVLKRQPGPPKPSRIAAPMLSLGFKNET